MYVTSWILHRVGQPWWTPSESKSVRLRTVSHRTHVISGSPPRNRYSDTDFMSLLRFRGAVVRDFLRPPGGDPVLGAALSGRHRRELVSQRRGRRLWRSAAGLAGRHERKGTGEETVCLFTAAVYYYYDTSYCYYHFILYFYFSFYFYYKGLFFSY